MRRIRNLLLLIVIAAVAVGGALWWEDQNFYAPGPSEKETVVIIRPGGGAGAIASSLLEAGVIERPLLFRIGVRRRDRTTQLKAGEYSFPAGASMAQVMDMLVEHKVLMHRITVAEGLTSDMALAILNADPVLEGQGTLLPETYVFERGTTRAEILDRMRESQKKLIEELWPKRKDGLPIQSVDDALKLASIVEKETGLAEERPRIAAVFVNRLKMGMKLESDPTIIYGLTKGEPLGHPLRQSELETPNPYSTCWMIG
jgi:peptidoglycan lytic transglycosylase G